MDIKRDVFSSFHHLYPPKKISFPPNSARKKPLLFVSLHENILHFYGEKWFYEENDYSRNFTPLLFKLGGYFKELPKNTCFPNSVKFLKKFRKKLRDGK